MPGLVKPELAPVAKPAPFGDKDQLFSFLGSSAQVDSNGHLANASPFWTEAETDYTRGIYNSWLERLETHPHVQLCRAFGFTVDIPASLSLGYGRAWQSDGVLALQIQTATKTVNQPMTLALRYRVLRDWFQWGPAHLGDALAAFLYPPESCEGVRQDVLEGRIQFKFSWSGFPINHGYNLPPNPNPNLNAPVENVLLWMYYPSAIAPTDASLDVLLGKNPGPDGTSRVSVQTIGLLVLTGSLCFWAESAKPPLPEGRGYQLEVIRDTNIFSQASLDKWTSIFSATEAAWSKRYTSWGELDQSIQQFGAAFRGWIADFAKVQALLAVATEVSIKMTVLIGTIGVALVAPEIGIPAVAAISAGLKVAEAALLGQNIDWVGTAITVVATVGVGAALEAVGVSSDTAELASSIPTNTEDLKKKPWALVRTLSAIPLRRTELWTSLA